MKDISQCLLGDESCLVLMLNSLYCVLPHSNFTAQFTQMWQKNTCPLAIHLLSDLDSWHHGRSAEIFFTDCQNFGLLPCILNKVLNLIWSRCVSCAYSQRLEKNSYKSSTPIKSWESQEYPSHLRSVACVCLLLATVWRYLQGNLKIIISTKYTT